MNLKGFGLVIGTPSAGKITMINVIFTMVKPKPVIVDRVDSTSHAVNDFEVVIGLRRATTEYGGSNIAEEVSRHSRDMLCHQDLQDQGGRAVQGRA